MRLTILGMNGPFPAPGGATSGYFLTAGESRIALDMGSGVLSRLTALTAPEELTALLLTHWHYDHCADVLPLIYRLEACAKQPLLLGLDRGEQGHVGRVIGVPVGDQTGDLPWRGCRGGLGKRTRCRGTG